MDRRGSIAIFAATGVFGAVALGGIAVDATRIWMVRSRLKTATDAAALVAARQFDQASRTADATAAFFANFNPGYRAGEQMAEAKRAYLGAEASDPVVTQTGASSVRVRATASVKLTLLGTVALKMIGSDSVTVAEASTAGRAGTGLELALVMDTTGSMGTNDSSTGKPKIETAKAAVGKMLDVLYGGSDTQPNLWVSVVPFARTINIGTGTDRRGWLDLSSIPTGWNVNNWSGCGEARQLGEDITETSPVAPNGLPALNGLFRPYFWADTYKKNGFYGDALSSCADTQAYDAVSGVRWCMGDNDWGNASETSGQLLKNPQYTSLKNTGAPTDAGASGVKYFGPNALCAQSALRPLAQSRTTVLANINGLSAAKRSGGTTVNVGMQGAWFTLSPGWQKAWNIPTPANGLPVPNAYSTRNMQKIVVLLSDGDNNWQGNRSVAPELKGTELFYNAYGRLGSGRLTLRSTTNPTGSKSDPTDSSIGIRTSGTSSENYSSNTQRADNGLDYQTRKVCKAMKDAGIIIYAIGIEVAAQAHRDLLKDCASSPDKHYVESSSLSDLENKFREIAGRIATPRLID